MTQPATAPNTRIWDYRVTAVRRVIDGDTFDLTLHKRNDFGFHRVADEYDTRRFRLHNIDVMETNEAGGSAATQFADAWIRLALHDDVLRGESFKSDSYVPDGSFGRWLMDLYRADTGVHLRDVLIGAGFQKVKPT